ncbi:hypothetical protein [Fodinicola acaciae]|uniref:hypothetical protein n=1 Tax=Fodinicola acaciae TaxID=2681555 RepID=UPI0013D23425|nr:hypothetical protein [Fodinicola acaciae]
MTYEDRLLTQLKQVVTENAAQPPTRARRLGWKPRLVVGGVAAALVAGGAVIAVETTTPPAFAVTKQPNGIISVTINRLEDADGLARQLTGAGIPTVAKFLPEGKKCADGWYQRATDVRVSGDRMSLSGESMTFTMRKGQLKPGQTLIISTQYATVDGPDGKPTKVHSLGLDYAQGPIGSCRIVAAAPFKPAGGTGGAGGGPYASAEPLPTK